MKKLGSERRVIVCGWVGGGEAIVVLKDLKARLAADLGGLRAFYELSGLSFQLVHEANSASYEGRGEDGWEKIVRERCVNLCGWDAGREGRGRFKGDEEWGGLRIWADLGGLRAFGSQLPASSL